MAWGVLLLALVGVGLYVGLQITTGVSPPVVPIEPGEGVPGYAAGDAVLLRAAVVEDVDPGTLVAVRTEGVVRVGLVEAADQEGTTVEYVLTGLPDGEPLATDLDRVVGVPGRKIPVAGWALVPLRHRTAQIATVVVVVLLVLGLLSGRGVGGTGPVALGSPVWATDQAVALPAGRDRSTQPMGPVVEPGPHPFIAGVAGGVAYGGPPMSITPDDLRQVKFAQTKRGYDTEAVDRALDSVADSIEQLLVERQQMLDHVQHLEGELARFREMEGTLSHTLAMAERTAEELKAEAAAEAQRIVAAAQQSGGGAVPADGLVQLLGETRAIRSLLQAVLTQGVAPMSGPPGAPEPSGPVPAVQPAPAQQAPQPQPQGPPPQQQQPAPAPQGPPPQQQPPPPQQPPAYQPPPQQPPYQQPPPQGPPPQHQPPPQPPYQHPQQQQPPPGYPPQQPPRQ